MSSTNSKNNMVVDIYVSTSTGNPVLIGGNVPFAALDQLLPRVAQMAKWPSKRIILKSNSSIDPDSAKTILKNWIAKTNIGSRDKASKSLKLAHIGDDLDFPTIIKVHATCNALGVEAGVRGDEIRDEILGYIRNSPLRADEFVMVHEWLGFDGGLIKAMKDRATFFKVNGFSTAENRGKIDEYAARVGWAQEMAAMEEGHRYYKAKRDKAAAEEARKVTKEEADQKARTSPKNLAAKAREAAGVQALGKQAAAWGALKK